MVQLTEADIARLLSDPSPDTRAETAAKIAQQMEGNHLSLTERAYAEDILRVLARDAALLVRRAVAEHLKESEQLPHDVALALARDVEDVALPVLRHSSILTDDDLIALIQTQGPGKQMAIATRPNVSPAVSNAVIESSNEDAVAALVSNRGAEIAPDGYEKILDRYPRSDRIHEPLALCPSLPVGVSEKLVTLISDQLRTHLMARHDLPLELASDLALQGRERATVGLVAGEGDRQSVADLIAHLDANNRLSGTLLLRAICMGDLAFFEHGLATLAKIPYLNAQRLIHDPGARGLAALYERAGLPAELFSAFRIALEVMEEADFDGGPDDRARFQRRVIERFLTQFEALDSDNLEYLLSRLSRLPSSSPDRVPA